MKNNLYLCGMTSAGNEANLHEMIEPILEYFDGLIWTFHYPKDEGAEYLEKNRKNGEIIYANYKQRHGFSLQQILWQGSMKEGDLFLILDSAERISKSFCINILPELIEKMKVNNIAMIANYGKGLLFRFNEQLEFRNSPHWSVTNLDGMSWNIQLSKEDFWNVRSETRDEYQFVTHYLKYFLFPAGSNHCLLGLEKNGNPNELFPRREVIRLEFRRELVRRGIDLTPEAVIELFKGNLDDILRLFIVSEKILNDVFRLYVLNDKNFKDDHDFKNMVNIDGTKIN